MTKSSFPKETFATIEQALEVYRQSLIKNTKQKELQQTVFDKINPRVNNQRYFTKEDISTILKWAMPVIPPFFDKTVSKEVQIVSKHALAIEHDKIRLYLFSYLAGIGLTTASKLLVVLDPHKYFFFNNSVINTLIEWDYVKNQSPKLDLDLWGEVIQIVPNILKKFDINGWEFTKVCIALNYQKDSLENSFKSADLKQFF